MEKQNKVGPNGLPKISKKSMLQQVMKPKDWIALLILIIFSAVCWMWVLDTYNPPIDIQELVTINNSY